MAWMYGCASRLVLPALLAAALAACTTPLPTAPAAAAIRPLQSRPGTGPAAAPEAGILPEAIHAPEPLQPEPPPVASELQPATGSDMSRELERGGASWYGPRFNGRRTASGERYDMHGFTAAHRSLPFGTLVRVRSLVNGLEVDVRINDRGPFSRDRIIDVSRAAADELGMLTLGVKDVVLLVPAAFEMPAEPPPRPVRKPRRAGRAP